MNKIIKEKVRVTPIIEKLVKTRLNGLDMYKKIYEDSNPNGNSLIIQKYLFTDNLNVDMFKDITCPHLRFGNNVDMFKT